MQVKEILKIMDFKYPTILTDDMKTDFSDKNVFGP